MATNISVGARLYSQVCNGQFMVTKCSGSEEVHCGGAPMSESEVSSGSPDSSFAGGSLIGKRYVNADGSLELLCVKAGEGSLSEGSEALNLKDAKPLPSSD